MVIIQNIILEGQTLNQTMTISIQHTENTENFKIKEIVF
jgi:hypothetical protein